jgi:hypothetical protein
LTKGQPEVLTHYLTAHRIKSTFINDAGKAVDVYGGLHPDDLASQELHPVYALSIVVDGLMFVFKRLYTSQSLPVAQFLFDAWSDTDATFGVPDRLIIEKGLEDVAPLLHEICENLSSNPIAISFANDRKVGSAKRSARHDDSVDLIAPHGDVLAALPLNVNHCTDNMRNRDKIATTPERIQTFERLRARVSVAPLVDFEKLSTPVKPWMSSHIKPPQPMIAGESLVCVRSSGYCCTFIKERKGSIDSINSGRSEFHGKISDIEGFYSTLDSLSFDTLKQFCYGGFDLDDMRDIWSDDFRLSVETAREFRAAAMSEPALFPHTSGAINDVAAFFEGSITRSAEIVFPDQPDQYDQHRHRFFIYELQVKDDILSYIVQIDACSIPPDDQSLDGKPRLEIPELNKEDFTTRLQEYNFPRSNVYDDLSDLREQIVESVEWLNLPRQPRDNGDRAEFMRCLASMDPRLVLAAFGALVVERESSYRSATTVSRLRGISPPDRHDFGISEAKSALEELSSQL